MKISILNTGVHSAQENMDKDKELLTHLESSPLPILHLYQWKKDSITYGHFAKPEDLLDLEGLQKHHIEIARRVTGGGVTLHFTDYAFSFLMPKGHPFFSENTLENYRFVNEIVAQALSSLIDNKELYFKPKDQDKHDEKLFFCMAKPTQYDVMIQGKKVGGAAQRRTQAGYLHHATIALAKPDPIILHDILKDKDKVYEAIYQNSFYLLENHLETQKLNQLREKIEARLIEAFQSA